MSNTRPQDDFLDEHDPVFFLVATYGEGDPTDSAVEFQRWLLDAGQRASGCLAHVRYGVFGLGNRQYDQVLCCGPPVRLRVRLWSARTVICNI